MRPSVRIRTSSFARGIAKACREYLRWFGNGSYNSTRNGEHWLVRALRPEGIRTVLDVGANVGTWALMAAETLPDARVFALEVVPATAATLRTKVAGQDRINCYALGLAAESGTLSIHYNPAASTLSTFTDYPHKAAGGLVECQVVRGDEFLDREGIATVDLLKLDVEGAEHLALEGLRDHLRAKRIRFIQFEYGRVNILTHFLLRDFYRLFAEYGYVVGKIFPDHVEFRDYDLADEDFLGPNFLACRADDPALPRLAGRTWP